MSSRSEIGEIIPYQPLATDSLGTFLSRKSGHSLREPTINFLALSEMRRYLKHYAHQLTDTPWEDVSIGHRVFILNKSLNYLVPASSSELYELYAKSQSSKKPDQLPSAGLATYREENITMDLAWEWATTTPNFNIQELAPRIKQPWYFSDLIIVARDAAEKESCLSALAKNPSLQARFKPNPSNLYGRNFSNSTLVGSALLTLGLSSLSHPSLDRLRPLEAAKLTELYKVSGYDYDFIRYRRDLLGALTLPNFTTTQSHVDSTDFLEKWTAAYYHCLTDYSDSHQAVVSPLPLMQDIEVFALETIPHIFAATATYLDYLRHDSLIEDWKKYSQKSIIDRNIDPFYQRTLASNLAQRNDLKPGTISAITQKADRLKKIINQINI